jgi:hypothetical protein
MKFAMDTLVSKSTQRVLSYLKSGSIRAWNLGALIEHYIPESDLKRWLADSLVPAYEGQFQANVYPSYADLYLFEELERILVHPTGEHYLGDPLDEFLDHIVNNQFPRSIVSDASFPSLDVRVSLNLSILSEIYASRGGWKFLHLREIIPDAEWVTPTESEVAEFYRTVHSKTFLGVFFGGPRMGWRDSLSCDMQERLMDLVLRSDPS